VIAQTPRNRGKYLALDIAIVMGFFATVVSVLRLIHGSFEKDFAFSALLGVAGLVLGVVVAVVITPFTVEEGKRWTNLTSALAGVAAGYGVKTLDDSISYIFKDAHFLKDPAMGTRVAIFVVCTLFGLIYGFSYRRYYVGPDLGIGSPASPSASEADGQRSTFNRPQPSTPPPSTPSAVAPPTTPA